MAGLGCKNRQLGRLIAKLALALVPAVFAWPAAAQAGCGTAGTEACQIAQGSYHVVLPRTGVAAPPSPVRAGAAPRRPAVMFLHGYGGSGAGALRNQTLVGALTARGYAVIAPDALSRGAGRPRSWTFFPGWQGRDEVGFLQQVAQDAADRFDLDRQAMVLAGFSAGGFMVSYLACDSPDAFAAYAPVAGGFWRPQPDHCAGPVRLFHSHGWTDAVVPLEGRFLGGGRFQQGDIFAGLALWRQTNGCQEQAPAQRSREGAVLRRRWDCAPGADIEFVLFPEGHQVPAAWAGWLLDWFEAGRIDPAKPQQALGRTD